MTSLTTRYLPLVSIISVVRFLKLVRRVIAGERLLLAEVGLSTAPLKRCKCLLW